MRIEDHKQVLSRLAELEREFGDTKDVLDHKMYEREVSKISVEPYVGAKARFHQWSKKDNKAIVREAVIKKAEICKILHGDRGQALHTEYRVKVFGTVPVKSKANFIDKDRQVTSKVLEAEIPVDGFVGNGQPAKSFFEIVGDEVVKKEK